MGCLPVSMIGAGQYLEEVSPQVKSGLVNLEGKGRGGESVSWLGVGGISVSIGMLFG